MVTTALLALTAPLRAQPEAKPDLLGAWHNPRTAGMCRHFPDRIVIQSANNDYAEIEGMGLSGSVEVNGRRRYTYRKTLPPEWNGPGTMIFQSFSLEYRDGRLLYGQLGPDGADTCMFTRTAPP